MTPGAKDKGVLFCMTNILKFDNKICSQVECLLCFQSVSGTQNLTFPNKRRVRPRLLKVKDNSTLNFLDQRLQTLVQHPLCSHTVWSPWEREREQEAWLWCITEQFHVRPEIFPERRPKSCDSKLWDMLKGEPKGKCLTSSDFTHLGDGRLIRGDTPQLLCVWSGCPWKPQHQCKQTLVPAKGLFGQLTACQWRVQGQVQLDRQTGWRKTMMMKIKFLNCCRSQLVCIWYIFYVIKKSQQIISLLSGLTYTVSLLNESLSPHLAPQSCV